MRVAAADAGGPGAVDRAEGVHRARIAGEEDALGHRLREYRPTVREARARGGVRTARPAVTGPGGGRAGAGCADRSRRRTTGRALRARRPRGRPGLRARARSRRRSRPASSSWPAGRTVRLMVRAVSALRDEVHRAFEGERARLHLDEDLVGDAERAGRRRLRRIPAGSAGVKAGSPRASRVVGTVTTTARHSSVPASWPRARRGPLQSMAVTGQSSTTSSPRAALATTAPRPSADRPVDVGVLGGGEVDGRQVRRVHAHRPAHDRVEQRPELQIRRQHARRPPRRARPARRPPSPRRRDPSRRRDGAHSSALTRSRPIQLTPVGRALDHGEAVLARVVGPRIVVRRVQPRAAAIDGQRRASRGPSTRGRPTRLRASSTRTASPAARQLPRGDEAGGAGAHDDDVEVRHRQRAPHHVNP